MHYCRTETFDVKHKERKKERKIERKKMCLNNGFKTEESMNHKLCHNFYSRIAVRAATQRQQRKKRFFKTKKKKVWMERAPWMS